ncbi:hypothetical protein BS47DRAFT_1335027 [Hydnum rufescens UP504]|uniref:Tc1-like transposase DDE domain-containing protein n=1 Tax=Hydnum rufescens UP504 TaxID=1448309 RepID=A0A9P6ACY7_9AGAM|nr:hypothetical protein BS47DRAFT_1335027 [Hydnum rufescens UP504]
MVEELISRAGHHCLFLPKFHCELNPIDMYWGYAKYRYCEVFKGTFAQAKEATLTSLNSCPLDTICHFINWSWRFMSAYRKGLTGKAAEWAVKNKKDIMQSPSELCLLLNLL